MHVSTIYLMLAKYRTLEQKLETLKDMMDLILEDSWTWNNMIQVREELLAADRDGDLL